MNVNTPASHFSLWLRMDRGLPIGLDIHRPASRELLRADVFLPTK